MKSNYTPKAIRGQTYPGHIKVSKSQVKKLFDAGKVFNGFLVGNKVNSFHFFNGWHLACQVKATNLNEFNQTFNSFNFYLEPELGSGVSIYLKKESVEKKSEFNYSDTVEGHQMSAMEDVAEREFEKRN